MDVTIPSEEELNQLLNKTSTSTFRKNYATVDGCVLPNRYFDLQNEIKNFEVFDDDVWICGFPKTGTTWTSEIVWLIVNNFDYEGAQEPDYRRTRMIEFSMLFNPKEELVFGNEDTEKDSINFARIQKRPRTLKSHFPFNLLPDQILNGTKKPKIIYTARNPMDTAISYYYQCRNYEGFSGSLDDFCQLFLYDKVNYSPYSSHVLSFWKQLNSPNILFLTYEELLEDISSCIKKIASHLGANLSDEEIIRLKNYVSFDSMKTNAGVNKQKINNHMEKTYGKVCTPFMRSGKSGGYKTVMSEDLIKQYQILMTKGFEGTNLSSKLHI